MNLLFNIKPLELRPLQIVLSSAKSFLLEYKVDSLQHIRASIRWFSQFLLHRKEIPRAMIQE